ncbi:radical SAM/SPASM domain-containing protein [Brevibacillus sp. SAFN-007a]|uniref:radical SAM/SPASM domain-containing protein n=1 Tax=Brevibacillus sp. SAFN-007a TaxID=3436862 RepID=UPI003F7F4503
MSQWFDPLRYLNLYPELKAIADGKNQYPVMVEMDLTDYCNHDCVWCVDRTNRKKDMEFGLESIFKLFDDFRSKGVKSVVLKGGGEPTTYKHFVEVLGYLKEKEIRVGLITNGAKLSDDTIRKAVINSCEWVRISLDAASTEMHDRLHRPNPDARLPIILSSAKRLIEESANTSLVVGFNFVYHKINAEEIVLAAEIAKELKARYIAFRPEIPTIGKKIKYSEEIKNTIRNNLDRTKLLETPDFKVIIAAHEEINQENSLCKSHSLIGIIRTDGVMAPCCFQKDNPEMFFGNVLENGLEKVWNSERRQVVIKKIEQGVCNHICKVAATDRAKRYWIYNDIISYLALETKQHAEFV